MKTLGRGEAPRVQERDTEEKHRGHRRGTRGEGPRRGTEERDRGSRDHLYKASKLFVLRNGGPPPSKTEHIENTFFQGSGAYLPPHQKNNEKSVSKSLEDCAHPKIKSIARKHISEGLEACTPPENMDTLRKHIFAKAWRPAHPPKTRKQ